MTNHWIDIGNSDCIMAIGANPAENHPAAMGWIAEAKDKGAKLISVDPRFTRTSAKADIYAPMRSGTDIAFIGGMIKYVLNDMDKNPGNYNMVYVSEYTNASFLINPSFKGAADLDGVFSGYDAANRKYDKSTWKYQLDANGIPMRDKTLQDPNCVFQLLKKHYARYTAGIVNKVCGTSEETFLEVCRVYAATGKAGKSGTILYAMGTTQHTYGTQNVRSYALLQLLLGNIGVAGGGINALRGESNVQGSTDHCLLAHILPGYLKQPINTDVDLSTHNARALAGVANSDELSLNWWKNYPKYMVSLLKAWWGKDATGNNDFAFEYLPKTSKPLTDYSWIGLFEAMYDGVIKGLMCWGQNPAVCGPNVNKERKALENLDWLVAVDIWHTETANFWRRPGVDPAGIKTEVFLLPAASSYEKEGSVTNSGRWSQWRYKCADAPGDAIPDLDILNQIVIRLKDLYSRDANAPLRGAITDLDWDYGSHVDVRQVAKEINGYDLTNGKLMATFGKLKDDGTTSSGNWLYCHSYVEPELEPDAPIPGNRASLRDLTPGKFNIGLYPKWSWCWPVNRRIIYNRASVDLDGKPWDSQQPVIKWNAVTGKWDGDVPDGGAPPMNQGGYYPFIMKPEGHARIFGAGRADGPFPEHYEPWESPVDNMLSGTQNDPAFKIWAGPMNDKGTPDRYPIVCSTYRLSEQWQGGQMSRNLPWLVEMQPEPFVEMSEELAKERGIKNGEKVIVESARGQVNVVAMVTKRFKPFQLNGKKVHQVGVPWHWGYIGLSTGDSANMLTPHVGDANTMIPEYKAFLVRIRKA